MTKEERMKQRGVWKNNPEYKESKSILGRFIPSNLWAMGLRFTHMDAAKEREKANG